MSSCLHQLRFSRDDGEQARLRVEGLLPRIHVVGSQHEEGANRFG